MTLYRRLAIAFMFAGTVHAADPSITAQIEPAEISLGQSASLKITASGGESAALHPPAIPGLLFTQIAQAQRMQSINGVTTSSVSVTYQVSAQRPGTYVISSIAPGMQPLTLKVDAEAPSRGAQASGGTSQGTPPQRAGDAQESSDTTAFVRLQVATHDLYVGQSVPVQIQVGTRDGLVASLNGVPTLYGDAFTLDKLSAEPESRTQESIDGQPFTVFTWHSVLAAVKPGSLSLSMQTPLTIRVRTRNPSSQFLDPSIADLFDDPAFQGFFAGMTQKDVNVSSPATNFTVHALPSEGRPQDFSGAVGQFKIDGQLVDPKAAVGDPVTLRLKVSGEGNFDRVNSMMLSDVEHFKTYPTTNRFSSADGTRYRGEKTFEQPVVPTLPGQQSLPALTFSYFDPRTRRYETAATEPFSIDVSAAPGAAAGKPAEVGSGAAQTPTPAPDAQDSGLKADHAATLKRENSLVPAYYRVKFEAIAALLMFAFSGILIWIRARARRAGAAGGTSSMDPARLSAELEHASAAGNVRDFFHAARAALQVSLGSRWGVAPEAVTLTEIDTRLGSDSEVRKVFALADEGLYSGRDFGKSELEDWKQAVLRQTAPDAAA